MNQGAETTGHTPGLRPPVGVSALVCHAHVGMALDCLGSLLRRCVDPLRLQIHDDGTLTPDDALRLETSLRPCRVLRRADADARMAQLLRGRRASLELRARFPLALKLLDAPLLCNDPVFAYCDSDVLFVRPVRNPFVLSDATLNAVFMEDRENCYSLRSWQKLLSPRVRLPLRANTGLMAFRTEAYDLDYVDWFLSRARHKGIPSMLEQTAWAALGMRVGCMKFDPRQVRVMREGDSTEDLVAGHFTARTRHLLATFAARASSCEPSEVVTSLRLTAPGVCGAANLAMFELRRLVVRPVRGRRRRVQATRPPR